MTDQTAEAARLMKVAMGNPPDPLSPGQRQILLSSIGPVAALNFGGGRRA
jgi:hypothetical protein